MSKNELAIGVIDIWQEESLWRGKKLNGKFITDYEYEAFKARALTGKVNIKEFYIEPEYRASIIITTD